jgi:hypothetical protein
MPDGGNEPMSKRLQVWRDDHPALNSRGHWEDVERPPTHEEVEVSARMPFGEFFFDDDENVTSLPGSPSATLCRIVEVDAATDIDMLVIRKRNAEDLIFWRILPCDLQVGDKVLWWDGTSLSLIQVVEADGEAHQTDWGTWVYHFRFQGDQQPRQMMPGEPVTILARLDES